VEPFLRTVCGCARRAATRVTEQWMSSNRRRRDAPARVENGPKKITSRSVPFSIFDPTISVFTKKYRNETETRENLFRPFLRDPVFSGLNPYLFGI
jgi:hypothetical protein